MIISIIGFMGCGKSSVGRKLSELLCCPFMDLDDVIEQTEGRSIPEIFATDGEPAFRQMELKALQKIAVPEARGWKQSLPSQEMGHSLCGQRDSTVPELILALGGGTVMTPECREIVEKNTICIYLKASLETLLEHLKGQTEGRPMLSVTCHSERPDEIEESSLRQRIKDLMAIRTETYEKTAHVVIETDNKSIKDIAEDISSLQVEKK